MGVPRVTGDFWSEQSKMPYRANRSGCLSQKGFVRQECIKFMIAAVRFWIYLGISDFKCYTWVCSDKNLPIS